MVGQAYLELCNAIRPKFVLDRIPEIGEVGVEVAEVEVEVAEVAEAAAVGRAC